MLDLQVESWIWYGVVMFVAASRFISRRMTLRSFRKYEADEYLMLIALCFYTTLIASINIVRDSSSNLLPPGFDLSSLTEEDIRDRQYGSKMVLVVEQCQCVTIWLVKGCLVVLYLRLTTMRTENILIKLLAAYIIITFIIMDSLYFGYWCSPFSNYWAVPTPNKQCDAATNHLIMNAVFNLTSDCAMLIIGLPMFLRLTLPWKKKSALIAIFSLGIFTIVAAILNKIYSFTQPFGSEWTYWYTRESSTALCVANLPFVWALWRRPFGVESIHGQSRQNSLSPKNALSRTNTGMAVTSERNPSSTDKRQWRRNDSLAAELEMEGGPGGMTLEDLLRSEPVHVNGEKEPTEFTHPHLFWSRKKAKPQSSIERAMLGDSPEQETVRRDSSSSVRVGDTPASSTFRTTDGKRSASSLV
ncbi:uncharacterized protein LTR77_000420 [Saxophila tyrrhenica]|uniref:Rhodopsin domain-containing protein n=1 Tax=Saxophila tyrrhenica TaxID=1690608 RepID=A0AAV9PQS7_9PEZI|nr:hypothetical protein LTR77_000420 [Saxophila tyrrhenica]